MVAFYYPQVQFVPISVIEILAGTIIDPDEVARTDRFSDEAYGNDLRRVKISARANLAMIHSFA